MYLKLKENELYQDRFGNQHNNFIILIENILVSHQNLDLQIQVKLYSSLNAMTEGFRFVEQKNIIVKDNLCELAIEYVEGRIRNDFSFIESFYKLLLLQSGWDKWELAL